MERGAVLTHPGRWRATATFDAWIEPVRGLDRIPDRGAFTVHAGAAETAATVRLGTDGRVGGPARLWTARPLVLEPGDRFVLREEGRRATVGGGVVLDTSPPRVFADPAHLGFLARRRSATTPEAVAALLVEERGAVETAAVVLATGAEPPRDDVVGAWAISPAVSTAGATALRAALGTYHAAHPLEEGMPLADARETVARVLRAARAPSPQALVDTIIATAEGVERAATSVRLDTHHVDLGERSDDVDRLRAALSGQHLATPPSVKDLVAMGFGVRSRSRRPRARARS